ncbi:MAG TPA: EVE domain-containing protein [Gammaproteobacteria bacterium]|nr:EVE domain-containing protein [Gammaproteobacteria bacterium]
MNYWLFKSEPNEFSFDDLLNMPDQTEHWDGVRNYQARNFMRDDMRVGDLAFFYHSNCKEPGIVGIVEVAAEGYPDFTAFDASDPHFDRDSDPDNPRWFMVDVRFVRPLRRTITLKELKQVAALKNFPLVRKGNRLSVMPVQENEWETILDLEERRQSPRV